MRKLVLLTIAASALAFGTAQAKVVSSSISTGEIPNPSVGAFIKHPSHSAILEVRASPRAPVNVYRSIGCSGFRGPEHRVKGWITIGKVPARIPIPLMVRNSQACSMSAFAFYKGYHQAFGRIVLRIRY
jgi:hypothetical protein